MADTEIPSITRACKNCGEDFSFASVGRGLARLHCSPPCQAEYNRRHAKEQTRSACSVEGCGSPANRVTMQLCEMHYGRLRRNGTYQRKPRAKRKPTDHGYMLVGIKGHPLAGNGNGTIYEHRLVLFEAIGPGAHQCFWCGAEVEWMAKGKRKLVVDHFDGVKTNNVRSNLLPSCNPCNAARGMFEAWVRRHGDDPFIRTLIDRQMQA